MPSAFYALVVCFISNVIVYFYCCLSVFLIVLIVSFCLLLIFFDKVSVDDFKIIYKKGTRFVVSKQQYKIQRQGKFPRDKIIMSSFQRKLSLSGLQESSFDSGLLSDYESRRSRTSIKSNNASPLRTFNKVENLNRNENFASKIPFSSTLSNILSPVRNFISGETTSPLSHSRRYNVNLEGSLQSKNSYLTEEASSVRSPILITRKKNSLPLSFNSGGSPGFVSQITSTANEMSVHQFPWVSPNVPCVPVRQPPSGCLSSPKSRISSPLGFRDSNTETPKRNRVRVRLTGPNRSDNSLNGSCNDTTLNLDDSCSTTKSVIQVLKEISRKRAYTPTEEPEEHQEAKRRTGHNLYLSRLETEQENPVPSRNSGEEERKRNREPDWDTQSMASSKRRRKNNHFVNNEIFSSLSSSIGLQQFLISPAAERRKQTVSVGTQVTLLKDNSDKKQSEQGAQTNGSKPVKEVKEAATMPDPPVIPRQRSPVKEKVVTDLNGILKSALSKFNIQPKEPSKKSEVAASSLNSGFLGKAEGTIATKPPESVTSSSPLVSAFNKQTEQTPTLAAQPAFSSPTSAFKLPPISSASPVTFGSPATFSQPAEKSSDASAKKPEIPTLAAESKKEETKTELTGFQFNAAPKEAPKMESPFTFGSQPTNASAATLIPDPVKTGSPFKAPDSSSAISSSATQPTFTFGSSSLSTASTVVPKPQTPVSSQIPQTPSAATVLSSSDAVKNEAFKFGSSGFAFKDKTPVEQKEPAKEEKKEPSSGIFSFGNSEKNPPAKTEETANKPFQFGSGAFTFGQNPSKDTTDVKLPEKTTSSITTTDSAKPVFSFSGGAEKKDDKPGGFAFQLPTSTPAANEQKPVFSFNAAPKSLPASTTVSSAVSTSAGNAKPIFPSSLFGSTSSSAAVSSSIASPSPSTGSITASTTANTNPTFGSLNNDPGKSLVPATSSAPPTFGSTASAFGSSNKTIFGGTPGTNSTPIFGSNTANNAPPGGSIFGSNVGSASSNQTAFPSGTTTFGASGANSSLSTFGSVTSSSNATFGNPSTTTAPSFGSTATAAPTFGSTGQPVTSTPAFGSTGQTVTSTPVFGTTGQIVTSTAVFGTTGQPVTSTPAFGSTSQTVTSTPLFGGQPVTSTPAFGSAGQTVTSTSVFGSTGQPVTSTPAFGSTGQTVTSTPVFGSTGQPVTSTPVFGSTAQPVTSTPAFGSTGTIGSSAPAFGSALATTTAAPTFGTTSTTTPSFGSAQSTNFKSLFGAPAAGTGTPAFGAGAVNSTPAFGSNTNIGSTPTPFGSNNSAPAFGSTNTTAFGGSAPASAPAFGSQPQAFGSQTNSTFGSTPAFGQNTSSSFGTPNTFNNQTSTPAFGAGTAFGTSTPAFNATPTPAAPAFGSTSTPAFGSTPSFGSQDANKPFTFNAPGSQPQAPAGGGFNFTAPQPTSSGGGLFQFGASSSSQPSQPFQFNAAQPSATVGGTGPQMFSIGSGSTAPRRVTARRKK